MSSTGVILVTAATHATASAQKKATAGPSTSRPSTGRDGRPARRKPAFRPGKGLAPPKSREWRPSRKENNENNPEKIVKVDIDPAALEDKEGEGPLFKQREDDVAVPHYGNPIRELLTLSSSTRSSLRAGKETLRHGDVLLKRRVANLFHSMVTRR